jgi:hypothetical protein
MVSESDPIENILDIGQVVFSVLVLAVSAGIAAHAFAAAGPGGGNSSGGGYGSRRWREVFVAMICSLLVAVQVSHYMQN